MKKTKRWWSILSICAALILSIALAGCSNSEKASEGKKGDVTLRILIWNNNPEGTKLENEIFRAFEKENPGIKVKTVYAPYDKFNDKFLTMSAGGDQPDLVWIQPAAFGQFVAKGLLMDLTDRVEKEINKDEFLPNVLELGQVNGKQYALIRDASAFQMGYNKDLFDKAGVPYPKDDWTWEDFLEAAKKLTKVENGKIVQFGIENFYTNELLVENGGGFVSPDGKKVIIDSPESIEAIQFGRDLIHKYHVQPTSAQSQGMTNMFLAGKAAMRLLGPWDWADTAKNANFRWDVVPMPAGKAGNVAAASYLPIGISKGTKHPEEAWKLLKFLTYGKGQDLQLNTISAVSVMKRNADKIESMKNAPENAKSLAKTLKEGKTVRNAPYTPEYAEIVNKIQPVIDNINLKNLDVEKELKKIADQIRKEYNLQ
ncbi:MULTISPECIES: ABC transporter substrate-binding protein [Anoxybacillaceae]|uniref:Putative ABC transporter substrate-binding protein n=1 Tax=Parageobacillus caldoxylosilyticus NBRC 107762 TaxID=1220594 RepID=A0A023DF75_9BACL|nr:MULTISPECIES: sugar ABC transporter substrate-binding protein [Bacillaceae]MED4971850.1 sugar ABC transporter substrate-binding protein [Geobacillus thermoleovorans]MBB3853104.1 multiple sugar transport system substrate-binding protein [Parageobacillus caldoxylosilyticus]QCK83064.1 sugar ABC transporter substrate-binding protein [Geobacillus kaustophilus NBRC 102445]QXJ38236.1 Putative ABC transporter substrate-binding protein YesO [Parageobacillus caldoxylosilyticus]BDG34299.1 ABC transpor